MESKARLIDIAQNYETRKFKLTFEVDADVRGELDNLRKGDLRLKAVKWREKRSLDANGLLWACLDKIASAANEDKWTVYLDMLKHYGKFTYVVVPDKAVESMKSMWRELEIVGDITVNGRKATQCLCYFGSSTYDKAEFLRLLDGVIHEMENLGIPTPEQEETERILDEWERRLA